MDRIALTEAAASTHPASAFVSCGYRHSALASRLGWTPPPPEDQDQGHLAMQAPPRFLHCQPRRRLVLVALWILAAKQTLHKQNRSK